MIKLTLSGEMMKELFQLEYSHIFLENNAKTNKLINQYATEVDNGMDIKRALDYLQDGIMANGMADYQE